MSNYRSNAQYLRQGCVALKSSMTMKTSCGNPQLALAATQFLMVIDLTLNQRKMGFQLVENLLRSFLSGHAWKELGIDAYSQQDSRFQIRFAPSHSVKLSGKNRREISEIAVQLDYSISGPESENIFPKIIEVSDYAMNCVALTVGKIAPAVFDEQKCQRLIQVLPLLRPLQISLDAINSQSIIEKLVERQILNEKYHEPHSPTRNNNGKARNLRRLAKTSRGKGDFENLKYSSAFISQLWSNKGDFCGHIEFSHRKFIVLTDDGDDMHEPIFFAQN